MERLLEMAASLPHITDIHPDVIEGSDGERLPVCRAKGHTFVFLPLVDKTANDFQTKFVPRSDDIWILAYPNSGTHWMWEVTTMLVRGKAERVETVKEENMIEFMSVFDWSVNNLPSPRVLNTHFLPDLFAENVLRNSRVINIVRNPRDVIVSFYNQTSGTTVIPYNGSFSAFYEFHSNGTVPFGTWFDHVNSFWEVKKQHNNFLSVTYEESKQDLLRTIRRIAQFLGLDRGEAFYQEVADLCTFGRMKAEKHAELIPNMWKEGRSFYRQGKVGGWKDWFTVAQSQDLETQYRAKITDPELINLLQYSE